MQRLLTFSKQLLFSSKKQYYFEYGVKMIPHPEKAHKGGEDAYYVS